MSLGSKLADSGNLGFAYEMSTIMGKLLFTCTFGDTRKWLEAGFGSTAIIAIMKASVLQSYTLSLEFPKFAPI